MSTNKLTSLVFAFAFALATPFFATAQSAALPGGSLIDSLAASLQSTSQTQAMTSPSSADAAPLAAPAQAQSATAPVDTAHAASAAPAAATPKRVPVSTELVTIESLANAQRRALLAKEADLKREAAKAAGSVAAPMAPRDKPMSVTPQKTRHLHAIYTNSQGELVSEIAQNGVLKLVRDGQLFEGLRVDLAGTQSIEVHGLPGPACKNKPCPTVSQTVRVGGRF
jgi:hypothetical protein